MIRICSLWSTENVRWKDANWTWDDCQLVAQICAVWGSTGVLFKNANWKWSECTGSAPTPPTPTVAIGNPPGVDAMTLVQPWMEEPWDPYRAADEEQKRKKQRRLIELVCKVKGLKYDDKRQSKDMNITVEDVRLVVKAVSNIDLDLKLEE